MPGLSLATGQLWEAVIRLAERHLELPRHRYQVAGPSVYTTLSSAFPPSTAYTSGTLSLGGVFVPPPFFGFWKPAFTM